MSQFIPELYLSVAEAATARTHAGQLASWDLSARQLCDLELILMALPLWLYGRNDWQSVWRRCG